MPISEQELNAGLDKMTAQTAKIAKEQSDRFDAVVEANRLLQEIINAGGQITQATQEKAAALQTALDELDGAIPDAPVA